MSNVELKEQSLEVTNQELILYHIVTSDFRWDNVYAFSGDRLNAKFIARHYGVELEFRKGQFRETGLEKFSPSYLERCGVNRDNSCISAVLVGDDRFKLEKAKRDIYMKFGVSDFQSGFVKISDSKLAI